MSAPARVYENICFACSTLFHEAVVEYVPTDIGEQGQEGGDQSETDQRNKTRLYTLNWHTVCLGELTFIQTGAYEIVIQHCKHPLDYDAATE